MYNYNYRKSSRKRVLDWKRRQLKGIKLNELWIAQELFCTKLRVIELNR